MLGSGLTSEKECGGWVDKWEGGNWLVNWESGWTGS